MLPSSSCSRAFALALLFVALSAAEAFAHCFVGARFFPVRGADRHQSRSQYRL